MASALFSALVLASACGSGGDDAGDEDNLRRGQTVPWPTDGWTVTSPAEMGMDAAILEGARGYAFADRINTQGVVIITASWSAGKSVASAVLGIAIDEGLSEGVDESMSNNFPEWVGTDKEPFTLRSVLLGGVIEAATGRNATDYGREKLFEPLGMAPLD